MYYYAFILKGIIVDFGTILYYNFNELLRKIGLIYKI